MVSVCFFQDVKVGSRREYCAAGFISDWFSLAKTALSWLSLSKIDNIMEAAAIKPAQAKNGKISLRFGDWEVRHFQSQKMTDEEFYAFCRENADLKIEKDIFGNITVMPPVSP